ncbi:MAG: hypothetical protein JJLCMIEE_00275 [Acidimicrobiales bacterium]|nr:hypothetical protein [Acidimicrobiales bacterium]RIK05484.1 MAG: hypothetical protein DCC48_09285 [Acidobacteriota bacterium]
MSAAMTAIRATAAVSVLLVVSGTGAPASAQDQSGPTATVKPDITVTSPAQGAHYLVDEVVIADFECSDSDGTVIRCEGSVPDGEPVPMVNPGLRTFSVDAEDNEGNTRTTNVFYTIDWALETCWIPEHADNIRKLAVHRGVSPEEYQMQTMPLLLIWTLADSALNPSHPSSTSTPAGLAQGSVALGTLLDKMPLAGEECFLLDMDDEDFLDKLIMAAVFGMLGDHYGANATQIVMGGTVLAALFSAPVLEG